MRMWRLPLDVLENMQLLDLWEGELVLDVQEKVEYIILQVGLLSLGAAKPPTFLLRQKGGDL
jgi:hypothetical protein